MEEQQKQVKVDKLRKEEGQAAFQRKLEEKWVDGEFDTVDEEWLAKKKWIMEAAEEGRKGVVAEERGGGERR